MAQTNNTTKTVRRKPRLSLSERGQIQALLSVGVSVKGIAEQLNRSRNTIYSEIDRGTTTQMKLVNGKQVFFKVYLADHGQIISEANIARCRNPKKTEQVREFLEFADEWMLKEKYSPDALVGHALDSGKFSREEIVCARTLYNYIDEGLMQTKNIDLTEKTTRKPKTMKCAKKNKTVLGKSIEERPESVDTREEFGHFEIDSVVGRKDKEDDCLLTLIERKTRKEFLFKMDGKDADSVNYAIQSIMAAFGEQKSKVFKSITADNGPEFAGLTELLKGTCEVYFTHPYSSWERGTNENHNRIVRRKIPKGTAIEDYGRKFIQETQEWMNNMPRKILNYKTPNQCFQQELAMVS